MYTAGKLIYFDPFHFNHGCLEIPEACINCYIFEPGRPITKSGWSFTFHTMLYGSWLDDFEVSSLEKNYPIAGVDYEIVGDLTEVELNSIVHCFANSSSVKRKYRRILSL